jgi:hypothetical protein
MKPHLQLRFLVSTLAAFMLSLTTLPALATPGDVDPAFNGGRPAVPGSTIETEGGHRRSGTNALGSNFPPIDPEPQTQMSATLFLTMTLIADSIL